MHLGKNKILITGAKGFLGYEILKFLSNKNKVIGTSRIKNNIKTIKRLPKIKGVKEIMYPGQNKDKRFRMNLKKEIKLSKIIQKDLVDLKN